jgi:hypothetical protein
MDPIIGGSLLIGSFIMGYFYRGDTRYIPDAPEISQSQIIAVTTREPSAKSAIIPEETTAFDNVVTELNTNRVKLRPTPIITKIREPSELEKILQDRKTKLETEEYRYFYEKIETPSATSNEEMF